MLQKAETIGVFQVESRAQMATLPRLKPTHFYDLVVEVAIIRPGPIVGQMVHPYLNRRAGRKTWCRCIRVSSRCSGGRSACRSFRSSCCGWRWWPPDSPGGQAEELRRAMGFKRSEKADEADRGAAPRRHGAKRITGETAERIITSITSFALYGFPESHAASFALLAYASAYLKVHYPAAFYTALLNNQPMGFYHPRRSSRTRSAAGSASIRSTCSSPTGSAASRTMAGFASASCT
jgi:error-prone DNA polymerase